METIIPDSISMVYFYCHDTTIFASALTYGRDTLTNKPLDLIRNIYFHQDSIIDDSGPGMSRYTTDHYINESRSYLELSKAPNLNMGIIELLNQGIIPDTNKKKSKRKH